jgi:hypothetical protein
MSWTDAPFQPAVGTEAPASTFTLVPRSLTPEATGGLVTRGTVPGFSRGPRPLGLSQSTYLVLSFTVWM